MYIPASVTGLKDFELRGLNAEINKLIGNINTGTASPQDIINRLHVLAVFLQPIDAKLQQCSRCCWDKRKTHLRRSQGSSRDPRPLSRRGCNEKDF